MLFQESQLHYPKNAKYFEIVQLLLSNKNININIQAIQNHIDIVQLSKDFHTQYRLYFFIKF